MVGAFVSGSHDQQKNSLTRFKCTFLWGHKALGNNRAPWGMGEGRTEGRSRFVLAPMGPFTNDVHTEGLQGGYPKVVVGREGDGQNPNILQTSYMNGPVGGTEEEVNEQ